MPDAAATYTFQDLSSGPIGQTDKKSDNPYQDLIQACDNKASLIQARYAKHREARAGQQRNKLLADDFDGLVTDRILWRLEHEEGFVDGRKCLVFWTRPTEHVKALIARIQGHLLDVSKAIWTMPQDNLHMTVLEVAHSLTDPEIAALVDKLDASKDRITDYTFSHRATLIKPIVVYDAMGIALSFLPAAGEALDAANGTPQRSPHDDEYTYHHLRRDIHALAVESGVEVGSRYVVPSAHLTIARFIDSKDFITADGDVDRPRIQHLVKSLDEINDWLRKEYWPRSDPPVAEGGEWRVGRGKGLDFRRGSLWYGGGETIRLGKGY